MLYHFGGAWYTFTGLQICPARQPGMHHTDRQWRALIGTTLFHAATYDDYPSSGVCTYFLFNPAIDRISQRKKQGDTSSHKMPSAISQSPPRLRKWERPLKTAYDLPWADIKVIDISTFDEPGEKEKLAEQLRDAVCPLNRFDSYRS
jgi:hypothetical protein